MALKSVFRCGGKYQMDGTHCNVRRAKKKGWALRDHDRGGGALSILGLCRGSCSALPRSPLQGPCVPFRLLGIAPATPLTGDGLQLQGIALPKVTALPKGQPTASDWFIQGNKGSGSLASIWATLKEHSASGRLWWSAEASFGTALLFSFLLYPVLPGLLLQRSISQDHTPAKFHHATPHLTVWFQGTQSLFMLLKEYLHSS